MQKEMSDVKIWPCPSYHSAGYKECLREGIIGMARWVSLGYHEREIGLLPYIQGEGGGAPFLCIEVEARNWAMRGLKWEVEEEEEEEEEGDSDTSDPINMKLRANKGKDVIAPPRSSLFPPNILFCFLSLQSWQRTGD